MRATMLKKPLACAGMALACVACTVPATHTTDNTSPGAASLVSGNTVFVTNRYGPSAIYFAPSGRFRHTGGSSVSEGSWRADKDQVCTTMDPTPERVTPEFCLDLAGKKMGVEWTGDDPQNGKLVFLITPGEKSARH